MYWIWEVEVFDFCPCFRNAIHSFVLQVASMQSVWYGAACTTCHRHDRVLDQNWKTLAGPFTVHGFEAQPWKVCFSILATCTMWIAHDITRPPDHSTIEPTSCNLIHRSFGHKSPTGAIIIPSLATTSHLQSIQTMRSKRVPPNTNNSNWC